MVYLTGILGAITLALAIYTGYLWRSTSKLVKGAEDTSKKDLRAYVSLEHIFFHRKTIAYVDPSISLIPKEYEVTDPDDLRIRIRNNGRTPAHQMTIRCECGINPPQPSKPHDFSGPLVDEQMLHPSQVYSSAIPQDPQFALSKVGFYVIGRMIYHDIYGDWWITDFCHLHQGEGRFTPYGDHNRERGPFKNRPD